MIKGRTKGAQNEEKTVNINEGCPESSQVRISAGCPKLKSPLGAGVCGNHSTGTVLCGIPKNLELESSREKDVCMYMRVCRAWPKR